MDSRSLSERRDLERMSLAWSSDKVNGNHITSVQHRQLTCETIHREISDIDTYDMVECSSFRRGDDARLAISKSIWQRTLAEHTMRSDWCHVI